MVLENGVVLAHLLVEAVADAAVNLI